MILIAIGSNLNSDSFGSPLQNCLQAIKLLKKKFNVEKISKFYETEPIPKSNQPWYVNGAIKIKSNLSPQEILENLILIEKAFKRVRNKKNEARTIDLDLLTYNDQVLNTTNLILPHPRMHLRKFVMQPVCDIDEEWIHPVLNKSAKNMIKTLANQNIFNIRIT